MWKVNRERLVLLAGPAAAVLQVAHPVVARGVAAHSRFRTDSMGRLTRTLDAVYTVAFGTVEEVEAVRASVGRMHRAVRGEGYDATDPRAQLWVLATLIMGSTKMYERFVGPLTASERAMFLEENRIFGDVFGLDPDSFWTCWTAFDNYWQAALHGPELGSIPLCAEVARAVICPDGPWFMRLISPISRVLALEMIPPELGRKLGLEPSAIRRPLWSLLDKFLPRLVPMLPAAGRFAPHYIRASAAEELRRWECESGPK